MYQVHCDPDGKLQMWIEVQLRLWCGHQKKKSQRASDKKRVPTNPTFFITQLCDFWQMTKKSGLHLKKVGDKCFKPHLAMGVKHDRSNLVHNLLSIKVLWLQLCRRKGISTNIIKVYLPFSWWCSPECDFICPLLCWLRAATIGKRSPADLGAGVSHHLLQKCPTSEKQYVIP